jgi:alpha-aminoadipic semialdehyde synthase
MKGGAVNIGIRREDKNRWEARSPLVPAQIAKLAHPGLSFMVQRSPTRAYSDAEFAASGARIVDALDEADIILSIKEVPPAELRDGKVHVFFSHTFKGQKYNMPMLSEILRKGVTLIDYEKITDETGRRLVFFGNWAGYAGLIDTLRAFGRRKAFEGVSNPFEAVRPTYEYGTFAAARAALASIGAGIREQGLPKALVPMVVGITGYGNVSRGVQEMLRELPVIELSPNELQGINASNARADALYMTVFREEHTVQRRDGAPFSLPDYFGNPSLYEPVFARQLPYLSILVNAVYWGPQNPHLVSDGDVVRLYGGPTAPKLSVIGDISCDIEGAVECTKESTEPDEPVYVWDTTTRSVRFGIEGHGPVIMAVDNLPCELPRESSETFGDSFIPFLEPLAGADFTVPFATLELPEAIKKAIIVYRGDFTPAYEYMRKFLTD